MMGRALPWSTPSRYGVEVTKNVSYGPHGAANHLDIWRLKDTDGPMPVVLYIHGGGFRALHKGTHWLMALMLARRGYLVVNINYRLSRARLPRTPSRCVRRLAPGPFRMRASTAATHHAWSSPESPRART